MNPFLQTAGFIDTAQPALFLGIFLATALFFITIYFGLEKKKAYLCFFSYALFEALGLLFLGIGQPLPFLIVTTLANLSLLYFFATFFGNARSRTIAGLAVALILIAGTDYKNAVSEPKTIFFLITWFTYALTLMACSWIALRAVKRNMYAGKLLSITTLLIFILNVIFLSESFMVSSTSISSSMLILAVTFTVLHDVREQQALVKALKIRAIHLENEMLKKYIQPHFLLNTLTVLSEWIESQPALAVQQIELLSQEFRFIARVSEKITIPIAEEIRICSVHLEIFNAKQSKHIVLETQNVSPETRIPPMIFHTLIENGLTHSNADEGRFVLEQRESERDTSFILSAKPLVYHADDGDGLGIKYVEARLEQAFPGRWQLTSGPADDSWVTTIVIAK